LPNLPTATIVLAFPALISKLHGALPNLPTATIVLAFPALISNVVARPRQLERMFLPVPVGGFTWQRSWTEGALIFAPRQADVLA
jgi:hypothetical protein